MGVVVVVDGRWLDNLNCFASAEMSSISFRIKDPYLLGWCFLGLLRRSLNGPEVASDGHLVPPTAAHPPGSHVKM